MKIKTEDKVLLGYLQDDEFIGLEAMFSDSGRSLFSVKVLSTEIEYFELDANFQSFLSQYKLKQSLIQGLAFKLAYRIEYLAKKLDYSSTKKAMPHKVEGFSSDIASHKLLKQMEHEASGLTGASLPKSSLDSKKLRFLEKFARTLDPICQINQLFLEKRPHDRLLPAAHQRAQSFGSLELHRVQAEPQRRDRLEAQFSPEGPVKAAPATQPDTQTRQEAQVCPSLHNHNKEQNRTLEEKLNPGQGYFLSNLLRRPSKPQKKKLHQHFKPRQEPNSDLSPQTHHKRSTENSLRHLHPQAVEPGRQSHADHLQHLSAFPDARFLANFKKAVKDYSSSKALFTPECQVESSCVVDKKVAVSAFRAVQAPKPQSLNSSQSAEGLKFDFRIKSPTSRQRHYSPENSLNNRYISKQKTISKISFGGNGLAHSTQHRQSTCSQLSSKPVD